MNRRTLLGGASGLAIGSIAPRVAYGQPAAAGSAPTLPTYQGRWPVRPLLEPDLSKLLDEKGRSKPVQARRMIDDMESDSGWTASDVVTLGYSAERSRSGTRSLRFSTLLRNEDYIRASRRKNGSFTGSGVLFEWQPFAAFARRTFNEPQDWSAFNRISLWCYVHPTTNPINTISMQFICDGASAGPLDPISVHYVGDLKPGEWNHLVWEIPEHRRDRVAEFTIFQPLSGVSKADADPRVTYDFDELAVERVDAEPVKGWQIAPGTIAFSHIGYQPSAAKIAIAPEGSGKFDVVDARTGMVAASFDAKAITTPRGKYRLLDFSPFGQPGSYRLRHGGISSEPFNIGEDAWEVVVEATLNAFYGLRCGFPVPGVHDACHHDVFVEHDGERRSVGGGWHDAANMTQGPYRTHLSIYALVELHDALRRRDREALADRALEEALWGIDWSLRQRFGPGLRTLYMTASYWTDGNPETPDDVLQGDEQGDDRGHVGRDDYQNTLSVLAGARAARALKLRDATLAARLLRAAREDFATVAPTIEPPAEATPRQINEPSWRDQIGYLTLAAVELFRATGDASYRNEAARLAKWLVGTQERSFVDGIPIAGYFYEDAGRTRIVHEYHNSFEDCGLLAFAALCDTFPDHPGWMDWYAGLAIYADHFCATGSRASAPFDIIPAAVWRRSDLDAPQPFDRTGQQLAQKPSAVFPTPPLPDLIRRQMQQQYEAGTRLGPDHRLRVFPLWYDHIRKGASTVHMSKTIGLGAAAATMNRSDLSDLAARQVQWVLGANPFSRSLLYGVGNAYWQNFTVALPNFVGGMSLGFNSYEEDAPAWGNNAVFPYKEMWVYSSCRMALNLARVGTGATVSGTAAAGARFTHSRKGDVHRIRPGRFNRQLPSGEYKVRYGGFERSLAIADGASIRIDLDPASTILLACETTILPDGNVRIAVICTGRGHHRVDARGWNVRFEPVKSRVDLANGPVRFTIVARPIDPAKPWLAQLLPDGRRGDGSEVGSASVSPRGLA